MLGMNGACALHWAVFALLAFGACGGADDAGVASAAGASTRGGSEAAAGGGNESAGSAEESSGGDRAIAGTTSGGTASAGTGGSTEGGAASAGAASVAYACDQSDPDVCVCRVGATTAGGGGQSCPASDCCVRTATGCACKQPASAFTCNDVKNYVSGAVVIPACPP